MSYRPPHLRGNQRGPPPARPATAPQHRAPAAATAGFTPSGASLQQRLSQRRAAAASCAPPAETRAAGGGTGFGTCMRMCCEREWREREQYRELSRLEYAPGSTERDSRPKCDPELAVKRFKRPDAGAPPPSSAELRPLPVLRHTVDFLLQLWQRRSEAAPLDRFAFISDRLRAVMQDISVQAGDLSGKWRGRS